MTPIRNRIELKQKEKKRGTRSQRFKPLKAKERIAGGSTCRQNGLKKKVHISLLEVISFR